MKQKQEKKGKWNHVAFFLQILGYSVEPFRKAALEIILGLFRKGASRKALADVFGFEAGHFNARLKDVGFAPILKKAGFGYSQNSKSKMSGKDLRVLKAKMIQDLRKRYSLLEISKVFQVSRQRIHVLAKSLLGEN